MRSDPGPKREAAAVAIPSRHRRRRRLRLRHRLGRYQEAGAASRTRPSSRHCLVCRCGGRETLSSSPAGQHCYQVVLHLLQHRGGAAAPASAAAATRRRSSSRNRRRSDKLACCHDRISIDRSTDGQAERAEDYVARTNAWPGAFVPVLRTCDEQAAELALTSMRWGLDARCLPACRFLFLFYF